MTQRLSADAVTLRYGERTISQGLSLAIPDGSFTVIVGPNACGKSTLLRALSRLLVPVAGQVILDGRHISQFPAKEVARRLGLLPQSAVAPEGITVADLVARGRYPHQSFLRQWTDADEQAVAEAMQATDVAALSDRLLDEPTTFLDIAHQIELMELLADLNDAGRTVVAVLHDLNQACRYASHLIAMRDGRIAAQGAPGAIFTEQLVQEVFGLPAVIIADPVSGTPLVVPRGRRAANAVERAAGN